MIEIDSYEQYKILVRQSKYSNNDLFPYDIKKYIKQKKLFYLQHNNIIFIFVDEYEYYKLVVHLTDINNYDIRIFNNIKFQYGKDIVSNLVYKDIITNEKKYIEDALNMIGFSKSYINSEYILECNRGKEICANVDIIIDVAKECQIEKILDLWKKSLPKYVFDYIEYDEWVKIIDKGNLLVAYNKNIEHDIVGALYYDVMLGTSTVHHIVVDEKVRGNNIAGRLLETWVNQCANINNKIRYLCWIEDNNISSKKMFYKYGFNKTGKISHQYVLKSDN